MSYGRILHEEQRDDAFTRTFSSNPVLEREQKGF